MQFEIGGETIGVPIEKVDRRKIYGWVERKAFDRNDSPCYLGSLSGDGLHIFGREAFEQGYMNQAGEWVERGSLVTVNTEGEELPPIPSSFKSNIALSDEVSVDDYLLYNAKSVYQVSGEAAASLAEKVGDRIFQFSFNYNTSYDPDPAFLLNNSEGLFMVVAQRTEFSFIGKDEEADLAAAEEEDADEEDEGDFMDFSMM
ncbi:MAG: hypothetical protein ACI8W8_000406 [Rhodothermales bacterium]